MSEKAESDLMRLLEQAKSEVVVGARYRHYKGLLYHVVSIGLQEEDLEPCVVYQAAYGDEIVWVRPISSWLEEVDVEGVAIPRFIRVES
jgi:hypothetical protein